MVWQLCLNAVAAAATIMLVAVGFSLIYSVAKFFNFAHAIVFTIAAYSAYLCLGGMGVPFGLSLLCGVVCATGLGCLIDALVFRRLRQGGASSLVMLLASLGVYIAVQNLVSLSAGDDIKMLDPTRAGTSVSIFGGRLATTQCIAIFVGAVLTTAVIALEHFSSLGRILRALACDHELAEAVGIRTNRSILLASAIGSALAAVAGILTALDVGMTPTMGMNALMAGVVAAIVGGIGKTAFVAGGALLLGFAQNFGVWKIGTEWQQAITFLILLVFLVLRPQGLWGKPLRKTAI
jgi:branched-chain amino acid transport system permease protein